MNDTPARDRPAPVSAPAGWYGKLACLGDFASRRLPRAFVERWDGWLQQVLSASRAQLGAAWLECYLTSPVWRFLEWSPEAGAGPAGPKRSAGRAPSAAPAAEAGPAQAPLSVGVLMPSVDRVGRYFPLCVAAGLPGLSAAAPDLARLFAWLDRIEALALATLDTGSRLEQFDQALLADPPPLPAPSPVPELAAVLAAQLGGKAPGVAYLTDIDTLGSALLELGLRSLTESARGATLWWTGSGGNPPAPLFACRGLPDPARYAAMLRGGMAPD